MASYCLTQDAAAASNGEGKQKSADWGLRDAISFATACTTKADLMQNKPDDMTDDMWEEVTVVFDLCKIHGTDQYLIHQKMIEHFEACGECVVPAPKDTASPAHQNDPVTPETTTPKTVAETEPDSTDSTVEKGLERRKAIEFLEQQDSQWDEEILERYTDRTGEEPSASQTPSGCVDTLQTIPWIDLEEDDTALGSKSPMSTRSEHLNLEPKMISEYEQAGSWGATWFEAIIMNMKTIRDPWSPSMVPWYVLAPPGGSWLACPIAPFTK